MLDLRLGMPFDEAVRLAGDYLEAPLDAAAAEPRPFQRARLGWSRDASQGIALFALPASDAWRLAGIARRLYFADPAAAPDRAAVLASLREKYGKEVWRDGERAFVWAASGSGKVCGGVAELIDERPGWTPDWPPGGRLPVAPAADEAWTGFAAHAACGPVLVALLNGEQGGPLADAAFAVFDPAWIAAQPGFAFAAAPAQGAKRKKRRIDF
jgi:hypothetical protein